MTTGHEKEYEPGLRDLILVRMAPISGGKSLSADDMFALARAELRAKQLDGRAELMNTMYGLCRGLTTACGLLILICMSAGLVTGSWQRVEIASAIFFVATVLYFRRAQRYSWRFADQVWRDFAALH